MAYIGATAGPGVYRSEFFSGDNTNTTFNLSFPYGNEASVLVFISGVKQKTDSYGLINGQIIFTAAPPSGTENIEIVYLSERTIQNPYLSADYAGVIRINAAELVYNAAISTGYNASSAGPLKIANNITVTVANNSTWTIF